MSHLLLASQHLTDLHARFVPDRLGNFLEKDYLPIKSSAEALVASLTLVSPKTDPDLLAKICSQFEQLKGDLEGAKTILSRTKLWLWEWSEARLTIDVAIARLDRHFASLVAHCDFSNDSIKKLRKIIKGPQRLAFEKILAKKAPQAVIDAANDDLYWVLGQESLLDLGLCFAKTSDRYAYSKNMLLEKCASFFLDKILSSDAPARYIKYAVEVLEVPEKLAEQLTHKKPELVIAHADLFCLRLNKNILMQIGFGFSDAAHRRQFANMCGINSAEMNDYCDRVKKSHRSFPQRIFEKGICSGFTLALASQPILQPSADLERRARFIHAAVKISKALPSKAYASDKKNHGALANHRDWLNIPAKILGFSDAHALLTVIDIHFEIEELSRKIHKLPKNDTDRYFFKKQIEDHLLRAADLHVSQKKELFPMSLLGFDRIITAEAIKISRSMKKSQVGAKDERKKEVSVESLSISKSLQREQGFQIINAEDQRRDIACFSESIKSLSSSFGNNSYFLGLKKFPNVGHAIYFSFHLLTYVDPNDRDFETKLPIPRKYKSLEEFMSGLEQCVKKYTEKNAYNEFSIFEVARTPRPVRR